MTPQEFVDKWSRADRTERQAAQEHFIDLCHVLGEPTPNEADDPDAYSFEKGTSKTDGSSGFADVWKRGCFGWEYKKDRANLDRAYQQLQLYSVALENPPLLVVSDTKRFRVYTNWTNTVQEKHEFVLEDLIHTETRELLRKSSAIPTNLSRQRRASRSLKRRPRSSSTIADRLRMAGHPPEKVAHFLNRLVFCLFAEDVNLLQDDLFKRLLDTLASGAKRCRNARSDCYRNCSPTWRRWRIRPRTHPPFQRRPVRRRRSAAARRRLARHPARDSAAGLGLDRSDHFRHTVRALPRSRQARADRRALHRPGKDHDDRRAGDPAPAEGGMGGGQGGDRRHPVAQPGAAGQGGARPRRGAAR